MSYRPVNFDAAGVVRSLMSKMDADEQASFARELAWAGMTWDMTYNRASIAKVWAERAEGLRADVVRSAVAKSLRGEPIDTEEAAWAALEQISKERSPQDQARYRRDTHGQFATVNAHKPYSSPSEFGLDAGARFANDWKPNAADQGGQLAFRRLGAGASLLQDAFAPAGATNLTLSSAQYAAAFGPHAAAVVVPAADKTAYRYRGTERASFDPRLEEALRQNRSAVGRDQQLIQAVRDADKQRAYVQSLGRKAKPAERAKAERDYAAARVAYAREEPSVFARRRGRLVHGYENPDTHKWEPGQVLDYWRSQLPDADLSRLQVASGNVPPSQGVILDAKGKAVAQSVGFGDDWYVPFSLGKLNQLKGGEYVRTRTFGGPTTEDIYTGLVHGARAVTVVSHSGSFTIEFDDSLTGGRRFNDKAMRMTARYGQLLDAVRSGQISVGSADPAMDKDLAEQAAAVGYQPGTKEYREEIARLRADLQQHPRLSRELAGAVSEDWLAETVAAHQAKTGDVTIEDAINRKLNAATAEAVARYEASAQQVGYPATAEGKQEIARTTRAQLQASLAAPGDDAAAIAMKEADFLGYGPQLRRALDAKAYEVVNASAPLVLNGRGYKTAMDALKEQFPYYIQKVEWHPWPAGKGRPASKDTGYVRPKANRPAAAKAGLYGHAAGAAGGEGDKRPADTIRFQATPKRAEPVPGTPGTPAAPGAPAPAGPVPQRVAEQQRHVAAEYFDTLRAQTKLGPEATDPRQVGLDVRNSILPSDPSLLGPELADVLTPNKDEFRTRLLAGEKQAVEALRRAQQFIDANKSFNLGEVAARYRGDAQVASKDWRRMLEREAPTPDLIGDAYTGKLDPDKIAIVYSKDPYIAPLIAAKELPDTPNWDTVERAFQADAVEGTLRRRDKEISDLAASFTPGTNPALAAQIDREDSVLQRKAQGLYRARALNRSYRSALTRLEGDRKAAEAAAPQVTYQGTMLGPEGGVVMSPEQVQAAWEAMQQQAEQARIRGDKGVVDQ